MRIVEVSWPARHRGLPPSHGYPLFSALCRAGLVFHGQPDAQVAPIGDRLTIRAPEDRAWRMAGSGLGSIDVAGVRVELGAPAVRPVEPSPSLWSPMVAIKGKTCDASMRDACLRQLAILGVGCKVRVEGRRVARVADATIVGYAVRLAGLDPAGSVVVQSRGLGGRNRMGMGVFVPC